MRWMVASVMVMTLAACTHDAVRVHARLATVASVIVQGAGEVIEEVVTSELEEECPQREEACIDGVKRRWNAVSVGYAAVRAAAIGWVEAIRIADAAEGGEGLERALLTAAARVVREYQAFAEAMTLMGVSVPVLPAEVMVLVNLVGGGT